MGYVYKGTETRSGDRAVIYGVIQVLEAFIRLLSEESLLIIDSLS
jgi:hypothetical protein